MEPYAILRTEKVTSDADLSRVQGHNEREHDVKNADPKRRSWNRDLLPPDPRNYRQRIDARVKEAGANLRKNGVFAIEVFLGASPEYFRPEESGLGPGEWLQEKLDAWVDLNLKYLEDEFGPGNTISAKLHLDEMTPHVQAVVVPIIQGKRKNRMSAAHWLDGPAKLRALHTRYADAMKPLGLQRGIEGSLATHSKVKKFYGAIKRPVETVKTAVISPPPPMFFESSRDKWAEEETQRILAIQQEAAVNLAMQARQYELARRREKEMRATAHSLNLKNAELHKRLRDIPVLDVLNSMGFEPDKSDKNKLRGHGFSITVKGQAWKEWYSGEKGGFGSIDLVMLVNGCDFKEAVRWLSDEFGVEAVAGAVAANSAEFVRRCVEAPRPPYKQPDPVQGNWKVAKDYLCRQRGISEKLVDRLHAAGVVYADDRANVVMCGEQSAEKRGTRYAWHGIQADSNKDLGGLKIEFGDSNKEIVVVESGIDAMSYAELRGEGNYTVVSTSGACGPDSKFVVDAVKNGAVLVLGFDNDEVGEAFTKKWKDVWKEVVVHKPKGQDWNRDLLDYRYEQLIKEGEGMKTYEEFCQHYELDKESEQSRKDYEEYEQNLNVFQNLVAEPELEPEADQRGKNVKLHRM